jgi:hypothetical protein
MFVNFKEKNRVVPKPFLCARSVLGPPPGGGGAGGGGGARGSGGGGGALQSINPELLTKTR